MVVRSSIIGLLGVLLGVGSALIYDHFNFSHIERRNAVNTNASEYIQARSALARNNAEFVRAFEKKISAMEISGRKQRCIFFYEKSALLYDGEDIVYCFDKKTGLLQGQL